MAVNNFSSTLSMDFYIPNNLQFSDKFIRNLQSIKRVCYTGSQVKYQLKHPCYEKKGLHILVVLPKTLYIISNKKFLPKNLQQSGLQRIKN